MQPPMSQPLVEDEPSEDVMENFPSKPVRDLSVFHIAFGIICFVCQLMAIANEDKFSYIASGIWGGILMAVAGSVGIVASKRKTARWIYSFLVFLIATSVSTFFIILYSSLSISYRDSNGSDDQTPTRNCVRERCDLDGIPIPCVYRRDPECEIRLGMNCLLLIVAVAELVISLWASVLCCSNTCCSKPSPENQLSDFFPQAPPPYPGQEGQGQQYQIMDVNGLMHTRGGAMGNPYTASRGQMRMLPKYIRGPAPPSYDQATSQTQPVPSYGQATAETQRVSNSNRTSAEARHALNNAQAAAEVPHFLNNAQAAAEVPHFLNNAHASAEVPHFLNNAQAAAEVPHFLNNAQAAVEVPRLMNNAQATAEVPHVLNNPRATAEVPHVPNNAPATVEVPHVSNNAQATAEVPHVKTYARATSAAQPIPSRMQVPYSDQASGEASGESQRVQTNGQSTVEAEPAQKDAPDTAVAQRIGNSDPLTAESHNDPATAENCSVRNRDLATADTLPVPDLGSGCLSIDVHPLWTSDHAGTEHPPHA